MPERSSQCWSRCTWATGQIDRIDKRTDVYGLAAMLYEILTGEPPFQGKSILEIFNRVIHSLIAGEASIYFVGRDVTERRQSEQTFQQLLESAPDAMAVVNESGQIVLINAQLERLFGFQRQELLGEPIEVLVPEEVRPRHPAHVAQFMAQPDFRPMASGLDLQGRRKDGSVFPAEISLSPVRTEQGLLVACAVRDFSHRQREGQPK